MDIQDLYQDLIIDHGTHPRNFGTLPHPDASAEGFNPLCGDKVQVVLMLKDGLITDARFIGCGCALSLASASLMTETLVGKRTDAVLTLATAFKDLLTKDNPSPNDLGKLAAFANVKTFPARVKCATLAWHTLEAAIQQIKNPVSTENGDESL